jgi:carbonic anhydrase
VQDIKVFANYGALITPALVVDGAVKVSRKLLEVKEIKELIK